MFTTSTPLHPCIGGQIKIRAAYVLIGTSSREKSSSRHDTRFTKPMQDALRHLFRGHVRRVGNSAVLSRNQRRHRPTRVPPVPLRDFPGKVPQTNTNPFVTQLLMSPPSPLLGAGGQEYLQERLGEYAGTH